MQKIVLEEERGKLDRAITFFHFRRAKKIILRALREARRRQEWFYIYYFTAQHYIINEKFREAIKYLDKALRLRPRDGYTYNDKAICLAELGEYDVALECFNQGIKKDRDCPSLYHNKGWLLNFLGENRKAVLCFRKALELEENRPESLYSLGDSYCNLGRFEEAKRYFQKTAEIVKGRSSYLYREVKKRIKGINRKTHFNNP